MTVTQTPAVSQPETATAAAVLAHLSPEDSLRSLLAEHDALLVEGSLGPTVLGWVGRVLGRLTFIFPAGQDPAVTLRVATGFMAHQGCAVQA